MADPVPEQFLDALETRLNTISTANGYKTTLKAAQRDAVDEQTGFKASELPLMQFGTLRISWTSSTWPLLEGDAELTLFAVVENVVGSGSTLHLIAHDVEWALTNKGTDMNRTVGATGGVVDNVVLESADFFARTDESKTHVAEITLRATLWQDATDPTAGRG